MPSTRPLHAAACLLVAACAPAATPPPADPVQQQEVCNAEVYSYLRGEPRAAAETLMTGLRVRILGPDDFVTRDYDPNRLTITITPEDTVGRVFCG